MWMPALALPYAPCTTLNLPFQGAYRWIFHKQPSPLCSSSLCPEPKALAALPAIRTHLPENTRYCLLCPASKPVTMDLPSRMTDRMKASNICDRRIWGCVQQFCSCLTLTFVSLLHAGHKYEKWPTTEVTHLLHSEAKNSFPFHSCYCFLQVCRLSAELLAQTRGGRFACVICTQNVGYLACVPRQRPGDYFCSCTPPNLAPGGRGISEAPASKES